MATVNPVSEALALLEQKQASLRDELAQVEKAVSALRKLTGRGQSTVPNDPTRPSVRTKVVRLLDEEPRDWSAAEIIAEYERRGDPIHGSDPPNALRAAFADAKKKGMILSTGVGRYQASKWNRSASNGTVPDSVEGAPMTT
jgi:hypothetical protein